MLIVAGIITGCSKDNDFTEQPEKTLQSITLGSNIDVEAKPFRSLQSRLQDTQIEQNEEVSLFITETAEINEVVYNNVQLQANGSGGFSHQQMYYPLSGNNIDLYAVHPYLNNAELNNPINFSVVADQINNNDYLASDLLYASKANVSRTKDAVMLNFSHKLSKFDITIIESDGADLTELNEVSILDVKPSTTINLISGALGNATGSNINVIVNGIRRANEDETEVTGMSAIIVPQIIPSGVKLFKITIGNIDYFYTTNSELTFQEGKKYNLKLTIKQTGIELSSTIEDWTDGGTISGDGEAE